MKKIKKVVISMLSLALIVSSLMTTSVKAAEIQPYAWPGRPGGNGDGSEEWLQGEYGETNGEFKRICIRTGKVADLNNQENLVNSLAIDVINALLGNVLPKTEAIVTQGGVSATGYAKSIYGGYKGNYYEAEVLISGRCMKTVTKTYENSNKTGYIATYERFTKW